MFEKISFEKFEENFKGNPYVDASSVKELFDGALSFLMKRYLTLEKEVGGHTLPVFDVFGEVVFKALTRRENYMVVNGKIAFVIDDVFIIADKGLYSEEIVYVVPAELCKDFKKCYGFPYVVIKIDESYDAEELRSIGLCSHVLYNCALFFERGTFPLDWDDVMKSVVSPITIVHGEDFLKSEYVSNVIPYVVEGEDSEELVLDVADAVFSSNNTSFSYHSSVVGVLGTGKTFDLRKIADEYPEVIFAVSRETRRALGLPPLPHDDIFYGVIFFDTINSVVDGL